MLAHLGRRLAILGTLLGVWGWVVRAGLNGAKSLDHKSCTLGERVMPKSVVCFGRAGGSGRDSPGFVGQTHFYQPWPASPGHTYPMVGEGQGVGDLHHYPPSPLKYSLKDKHKIWLRM